MNKEDLYEAVTELRDDQIAEGEKQLSSSRPARFRLYHTKKRYAGMETLLSELEDCLPDPRTPETELDRRELVRVLQSWTDGLGPEDRRLFVRRYWHGVSVRQLAREAGVSQNAMTQRLARLRRALRSRLEEEGVIQ